MVGGLVAIYAFKSFFLLGYIVDIVELPAIVGLSSDGLLNYLIELLYVFVHQGGCLCVQRLLQISSFNVLKQVQQANHHHIKLIVWLPPLAQQVQTHVSILVDIGM